jgi:hypothetical protein
VHSGIRIEDGGISLGRSLGAKRLKILYLLSQHPEIDDPGWHGNIELHVGERSVKGSIHQLVELSLAA